MNEKILTALNVMYKTKLKGEFLYKNKLTLIEVSVNNYLNEYGIKNTNTIISNEKLRCNVCNKIEYVNDETIILDLKNNKGYCRKCYEKL